MPNKQYSVEFTPIAMSDLEEIYIYIATQLYNERSASGIIDKIKDRIKQLETFPLSGAMVQDNVWPCKGYRMLVIEKYLVFYKVDEDEKLVIIVRVLCGLRNYPEVIESEE